MTHSSVVFFSFLLCLCLDLDLCFLSFSRFLFLGRSVTPADSFEWSDLNKSDSSDELRVYFSEDPFLISFAFVFVSISPS